MIWVIKLRRMIWAGCVACVEEKRNAYRVFVREREGKGPFGRPRLRRTYNIKMDFKKQDEKRCAALIWLMLGTVGGILLK
jgi:hypothetical protein